MPQCSMAGFAHRKAGDQSIITDDYAKLSISTEWL